ncbi:MAG: WGR domain-containing protein [Alphaproteobacteria bacterium]|nr:WGR domain-containing protein [Alphaproteobacteria bacterium]MBV9370507.1 WGR domain-containing protein [Alphaproteobacteria bacterium]MBV9901408.1 WGR domain-containing protein [Alphaproteobacteria bacterium]
MSAPDVDGPPNEDGPPNGEARPPRRLGEWLQRISRPFPTEDLVHAMVPLFREVAALHRRGLVADIGPDTVVQQADGRFALVDGAGRPPALDDAAIRRVQPNASSALKIVGEYRVTNEEGAQTRVDDLRAGQEEDEAITKPVYLPGLRSWEIALGHHDEITDVFQAGMVLATLACGLDLSDADAVERFSLHRSNLFALAPRLHPVVATLILEATALNRHERATDLEDLAKRLENYRDQPAGLAVERALSGAAGTSGRRTAVLAHLRDRLFDLSRRNRLLHFRSTQSSVNLTEGSMPIVMRLESVRGDQLCTWKGDFAADVLGGKALPLNRWLRFEDQPHLPSAFDRIIQETRRDRAEYGFSNLRLVIAFLHWHNLKEAPDERIVSPLLWLPAELSKAKGVADRYMLRCPENLAEFNPALRHQLRSLYDIALPETVDLGEVSLSQIHDDLLRQIHASEPGVRLELQDKPQIRLILQRAVQRVNRFQRRKPGARQSVSAKTDFSYARDDYRPLGAALFEKFVRPSPLPQRMAAGGPPPPRSALMVAESQAMTYSSGVDEGHRFAWQVDLTAVTLANLNYKKMSLVRDYAELIERDRAQPAFDQIFSIEPRPFVQQAPPPVALAEQWNVVAADATQDAAVAPARTGRSFIIQGPPGTGKSQTITNLIADYAARGRRVLFVCEKRAALDVVFHRLGQAGLDQLACVIHDSQEDKKPFIADLKQQYERWGKTADRLNAARAARDSTIAVLAGQLETIDAWDRSVGSRAEGPALRALVRRAAALPPAGELTPALREALPTLAAWDAHRALADRLARAAREAGGQKSFAPHPLARLGPAIARSERPASSLEALVDRAEALLARLDRWLDGGSLAVGPGTALEEALAAAQLAERLDATGLAGALELLDPSSPRAADLRARTAGLAALDQAEAQAAANAQAWLDPLSPADTAAALAVAEAKEGSFFRFLSGPWRQLKATLLSRYDFAAHAVRPSLTSILRTLADLHAARARAREARAGIEASLQTTDLAGLLALRDALAETPPEGASALLLERLAGAAERAAALAPDLAAAPLLRQLSDALDGAVEDAGSLSFDALGELLRDLRESGDDLPELALLLLELDDADPAVARMLRTLDLPLPRLEALVVAEAIARIERRNPDVRRVDVDRLVTLTRRAAAARERLRTDNAAAIDAIHHANFRRNVQRSETSVTQLDNAGRAFKKAYATGRRELEHEFGKTMRHRSIRDLADDETGRVVGDLKPIWLMSPLSVSDTLPLQPDLFDVVVFDEASQIPMEEAVPALCRSAQVIVVGDEMQLPPTSFFAAALAEDEMQVVADEDGERIAILLDADSLLNQAARNLPATLLAWHYRSRSEALISFSNAAFYAGQLVTIPDRALPRSSPSSDAIRADDPEAAGRGVDRLLDLPITTHRISDGVYQGRINPAEARYIAALVRELLSRETGQSLGIVAFSEAQQGEIEAALDALAAEDPGFAAALEKEEAREDDGQFNGLFVKNLENVQGDERDIIVMSVCYAPGPDGRMAMNFGPINQRGGEKRLNVIFSRARRHMAIVSTIAPEAITNVHNDGARALRTFLAFADAQSHGSSEHAQAILTTLNPEAARTFGAAAPPDPVREALAAALRARGHEVHEHVGGASFRCDLAIVAPDRQGYALGLLLDRDDGAGGSIEERFVFRPAILRGFGWRVLDVPVASWLRSREATVERIERELERDSWALASEVIEPAPVAEAEALDSESEPEADVLQGAGLTEFRLVEGGSNKFWRVGTDGCDLVVEFGRVGTKGQRLVKTFEDPERARREAVKLTLEKTRKGYSEAG